MSFAAKGEKKYQIKTNKNLTMSYKKTISKNVTHPLHELSILFFLFCMPLNNSVLCRDSELFKEQPLLYCSNVINGLLLVVKCVCYVMDIRDKSKWCYTPKPKCL